MTDIETIVWPQPTAQATKHGCEYLQAAFSSPARIMSTAFECLNNLQFDTVVCTGTSGLLVAPLIARAMGRHLLVVRKPSDKKNHSLNTCEGWLGSSWLFVDDQISSGTTLARVAHAVRKAKQPVPQFMGAFLYDRRPHFVTNWNSAVQQWIDEDYNPDLTR